MKPPCTYTRKIGAESCGRVAPTTYVEHDPFRGELLIARLCDKHDTAAVQKEAEKRGYERRGI